MKKLIIPFLLVLFSTELKAQTTLCPGEQTCLVAGSFTGTIQWQSSTDLISWSNIPAATTDTFCFAFSATAYFRAAVTTGTCDPFYSDTTLLTLNVASSGVDTFFFTGSMEQFVVPAGCVDSITITCYGAQGGEVTGQSPFPQGGLGAIMQGKFDVTPGQIGRAHV